MRKHAVVDCHNQRISNKRAQLIYGIEHDYLPDTEGIIDKIAKNVSTFAKLLIPNQIICSTNIFNIINYLLVLFQVKMLYLL